jgi:ABC-type phosphate/phosphonate transport system permease subunit
MGIRLEYEVPKQRRRWRMTFAKRAFVIAMIQFGVALAVGGLLFIREENITPLTPPMHPLLHAMNVIRSFPTLLFADYYEFDGVKMIVNAAFAGVAGASLWKILRLDRRRV